MEHGKGHRPRILLAGSSHVRLFFPYVKDALGERALVSRLPRDAGRTDEILKSLRRWPLEDKDVVYLYTGHRDLMFQEHGQVFIHIEEFEENLRTIIREIQARTPGILVLSSLPPVSEGLLAQDEGRNRRIDQYNEIIERAAKTGGIRIHDFRGYALMKGRSENIYIDGLHFSRQFYREFGKDLATFLLDTISAGEGRPDT